ncbi:uncharacterized protein SPSK_08080 [Sporothrix schenckii 1099-18]|uniref:Uncharacterized protein n=1 Tax=Sporothrix schenckii 1099-18 TaxID=1397361 RepID=A0A0F2MI54_SPOSC|nr:uncharacterized protein SPSK_08080 [Sporothrix schenckii 1099-18]KJR88739.1 hypothetical protein SPSK_08080 [Sporothrix schenckii 1099-18]
MQQKQSTDTLINATKRTRTKKKARKRPANLLAIWTIDGAVDYDVLQPQNCLHKSCVWRAACGAARVVLLQLDVLPLPSNAVATPSTPPEHALRAIAPWAQASFLNPLLCLYLHLHWEDAACEQKDGKKENEV